MNINRSNLFWGILLIGGGALLLLQQMGYMDQFADRDWMWIFGFISLAAFIGYGMSQWKEWPWLFPAGVFGGLAVTVGLATSGTDNAAIGSPLFFGLLLPFLAAYLTDRVHNWWALIPGGVMLFLALTTLLVDNIGGEWIGTMILLVIALSFLAVYLSNRTHVWALLVAYIMGVISLAPAMAAFGALAAYYGSVFLLAVALPFFVLYVRSPNNWWAIIPAGVMTVLAVIAAFAVAGAIQNEKQGGYANAFLMFGLAAIFTVIWLRHGKAWGRVAAIILAAVGVASLFFVTYTQYIWPLAIILAGGYLLFTSLKSRTAH